MNREISFSLLLIFVLLGWRGSRCNLDRLKTGDPWASNDGTSFHDSYISQIAFLPQGKKEPAVHCKLFPSVATLLNTDKIFDLSEFGTPNIEWSTPRTP